MGSALCNLVQAALIMFQAHVDTPANQQKINEIIQQAQKECVTFQKTEESKKQKAK